jgi:hypothetical protein
MRPSTLAPPDQRDRRVRNILSQDKIEGRGWAITFIASLLFVAVVVSVFMANLPNKADAKLTHVKPPIMTETKGVRK